VSIKLEAGRYYKRRDGAKAFYHGPDPFKAGWGVVSWECGSYRVQAPCGFYSPILGQDAADLVAEWREPRTATCKRDFVLVKCPRESAELAARIEGSECSKCRIIGRKTVEVSITEGEGMEHPQ